MTDTLVRRLGLAWDDVGWDVEILDGLGMLGDQLVPSQPTLLDLMFMEHGSHRPGQPQATPSDPRDARAPANAL
jgi:hypothetical protein